MKFYFTVQGGSFDKANTIWVWPAMQISQLGKNWVVACHWLFWTIGVQL